MATRENHLTQDDSPFHKGFLFPTLTHLEPGKQYMDLVPIRVKGAYDSLAAFIKDQRTLIAVDFLRSLNEQVNAYRNTGVKTGKIFEVEFTHTEEEEFIQTYGGARQCRERLDGVCLRFIGNRHTRIADDDKRFMFENALLFSNDNFKSCIVGVVKSTNLRDGTMLVKLCKSADSRYFRTHQDVQFDRKYLMIEAAAYYFPYLHVTNALRHMGMSFPFTKEIVQAITPSEPPRYLMGKTTQVESALNSVEGMLNGSQLEALKSVLRHRVALVQGPPGTGKTYLGCKIVETLLLLKESRIVDAPILVVTTTQHAVDEFLKRCLQFTDKIVLGCSTVTSGGSESTYGVLQGEYNNAKFAHVRKQIMSKADVIGVTTTRAAFIRDQLRSLSVRIVIVEEAAEALESFVLASIPASAHHLILIGDHKQLCPSVEIHELAVKYHLDLSLFERLINNKFDCPMLLEQRRMRPEISRLIRYIYPQLTDHPSTKDRPPITGMRKDVFFLTHNHEELQDLPNPSYYNTYEAQIIVGLCLYLIERGHWPDDITILTTYRKQLNLIRSMAEGTMVQDVRATTVDNFQGEENKIILLSLVRSNTSGSLGFIERENRACVALSRARDGFYVVTNVDNLKASRAPVWAGVIRVLTERNLMGKSLPLICPHGRCYEAHDTATLRTARLGCSICQVTSAHHRAASELAEKEDELAELELEWKNLEKTAEAFTAISIAAENVARARHATQAAESRMLRFKYLLSYNKIDILTDTVESVELRASLKGMSLA